LLNRHVRFYLTLQAARAPLKAGALRYIQVADLYAPALGRKLAREKAGKGAFANASFLRNHCDDKSHCGFSPSVHAVMLA
jgi:hypothetical protein